MTAAEQARADVASVGLSDKQIGDLAEEMIDEALEELAHETLALVEKIGEHAGELPPGEFDQHVERLRAAIREQAGLDAEAAV